MKKTNLLIIFILLINQYLWAQDKYYMPNFEVINMHHDYQVSSSRLLKLYVEANGKAELILDKHDSLYKVVSKEQALIQTRNFGASFLLMGELNRLGEMVVVSLNLYDINTGNKIWNGREKTTNPNDLDPVIQKLAIQMLSRGKSGKGDDINTVTDQKAKPLHKIIPNNYFGLEIGGVCLRSTKVIPAGFTLICSSDMRWMIVDLRGSMYFGDVSLINLSLHLNYPIFEDANTPFFGGGLGIGGIVQKLPVKNLVIMSKYESAGGIMLYLGGGYIISRNSNVNVRISANLFHGMYSMPNSLKPEGVSFGLAVLF